MDRRPDEPSEVEDDATEDAVPDAPQWVTQELIDYTIRVWQPRYETPLTDSDAIEIIAAAYELLRAIAGDNQ